MTRAIYYPRADRTSQWFSDGVGGRTSNRGIVWHTTEMGVPGEPWPAYVYDGQRGGSAPHFTVKPDRANRRLLWRQHWRLDESARALAHPAGTAQTNNTGVIQVELGGTCVRGSNSGYVWPEADDWALAELAAFARFLHDEWAIPLTDEGRAWPRYGTTSARLSDSAWLAGKGMFGHLHVPGNDHTDPGDLDVARIIALAKTGDDDMAYTEDQLRKFIREEVRAAFAEAWVNADEMLPAGASADTKISPLNMIRAVLSKLPAAVGARKLGASGPTVDIALQSGYHASVDAADRTQQILDKLSTPPA